MDVFYYIRYRNLSDAIMLTRAFKDDEIRYKYITFGDYTRAQTVYRNGENGGIMELDINLPYHYKEYDWQEKI